MSKTTTKVKIKPAIANAAPELGDLGRDTVTGYEGVVVTASSVQQCGR